RPPAPFAGPHSTGWLCPISLSRQFADCTLPRLVHGNSPAAEPGEMPVSKRELFTGYPRGTTCDPQLIQCRDKTRAIGSTLAVDEDWRRGFLEHSTNILKLHNGRHPRCRHRKIDMPHAHCCADREFVMVPSLPWGSAT